MPVQIRVGVIGGNLTLAAMSSVATQLRIVLQRNYYIKRRSLRDALSEVWMPLLFFCLMLALKAAITSSSEDTQLHFAPLHVTTPSAYMRGTPATGPGGRLLYCPGGSGHTDAHVEAVMDGVRRRLDPDLRQYVVGVADERAVEALWDATTALAQGPQLAMNQSVFAALVFPPSSSGGTGAPFITDDVQYYLRFNGSSTPDTTVSLVGSAFVPWQSDTTNQQYVNSGFLALQRVVNEALIEYRLRTTGGGGGNGDANATYALTTQLQSMPIANWYVDSFHTILVIIGPLYMVLGFFPIFQKFLQALVLEKERRTREGMKMMGLRGWVLNLAWWCTYALVTLIPVAILSILASVFNFYKYTAGWAIFLLMYCYVQSLMMLAFVFSNFLDKSKTAGQVGGLIPFLLFVPSFALNDNSSAGGIGVACLSAPIAFAQGFKALADGDAERHGVGMDGNWHGGSATPFGYSSCLGMLLLDWVLYGVLAWYLEQIVPGEYGTTKPWWFCCSPEYCCADGGSANAPGREVDDESAARTLLDAEHHHDAKGESLVLSEAVDRSLADREQVTIRGLRKVYDGLGMCGRPRIGKDGKPEQPYAAVQNLSLRLYEGQILALLGHNGAGKSTTIGMLTGLIDSTSGRYTVYGHDSRYHMEQIRKMLGVCPQHDILFDQLTVTEHLRFYALLKGVSDVDVERAVAVKLTELDLHDKRDTPAASLSGGQKRRLSVAIALIGNSRVIFLDEPTSGMDPVARRKVWSLLQRYAAGRVIVLTTHYMDEADLLGDRIAILAKGTLQVVGSSLFLKARFGIGYHLDMVPDPDPTHARCDKGRVTALVAELVPGAKPAASTAGSELSYVMPYSSVEHFASLFARLEEQRQELGVLSFGISLTTLEEVFLNLADHQAATSGHDDASSGEADPNLAHFGSRSDDKYRSAGSKAAGMRDAKVAPEPLASPLASTTGDTGGVAVAVATTAAPDTKSDLTLSGQSNQAVAASVNFHSAASGASSVLDVKLDSTHPGQRRSGHGAPPTHLAQFRAMAWKRLLLLKRNKRGLFFQFVFPMLFILTVFIATLGSSPTTSSVVTNPPLSLAAADGAVQPAAGSPLLYAGASGAAALWGNQTLFVPHAVTPNTFDTLLHTLLTDSTRDTNAQSFYGAVYTESLAASSTNANFTVLNNISTPHIGPVLLNTLASSILKTLPGTPNGQYSVSATAKPFSYQVSPDQLSFGNTGVQVAVFVGLAFAYIPVTFAVNQVRERETGAKHQQIVMGTHPLVFWVANFAVDFASYLLSVALSFVLFGAFGQDMFFGPRTGAAIVLFIWYGLSATGFTYLVSFAWDKSLTLAPTLSMGYGFGSIILFYAVYILWGVFKYEWMHVLGNILQLLPPYSLMWNIYQLNEHKLDVSACATSRRPCTLPSAADAFGFEYIGVGLVCMTVTGVVSLVLAVLIDTGAMKRGCKSKQRTALLQTVEQLAAAANNDANGGNGSGNGNGGNDKEDDDVATERRRVEDMLAAGREDTITLANLRKVYDATVAGAGVERQIKVAVDRLTLGIPDGECFGLLGPNGAGKSTTLNILTGDLDATSGDATLDHASITHQRALVYHKLGFCPQSGGLLDTLTGREHLTLFCRLKGLAEQDIPAVVAHYLSALRLTEHADKFVEQYSGGNQRKLSLAVALMGAPRMVLLDEPSSGMDPVARRAMWDVIAAEMKGRSVILTTHAMDEADALATRIGILVNGRLQCVGSAQHLKSKYGSGYQMELKTAADDDPAAVQRVAAFVTQLVPSAVLSESFGGKLRYTLPRVDVTLSKLFGAIQKARADLAIVDYSLSQTTLEQVFIGFAKGQHEASHS